MTHTYKPDFERAWGGVRFRNATLLGHRARLPLVLRESLSKRGANVQFWKGVLVDSPVLLDSIVRFIDMVSTLYPCETQSWSRQGRREWVKL
jgi:hypothetical protein